MEKPRAVFLDRDGTIIADVSYPRRPEAVKLLPGVGVALRELKGMGFLLVAVSNQSGIGRGLVTQKEADSVHRRMEHILATEGVSLDGALYCPHAPDAGCDCRKPKVGMFLRAAVELQIDLSKSFMVGDKASDAEAGRKAGCTAILLGTPGKTIPSEFVDCVAADWQEAVERIKRTCDPQRQH